jgi:hypothetical protein
MLGDIEAGGGDIYDFSLYGNDGLSTLMVKSVPTAKGFRHRHVHQKVFGGRPGARMKGPKTEAERLCVPAMKGKCLHGPARCNFSHVRFPEDMIPKMFEYLAHCGLTDDIIDTQVETEFKAMEDSAKPYHKKLIEAGLTASQASAAKNMTLLTLNTEDMEKYQGLGFYLYGQGIPREITLGTFADFCGGQ